MSIKTIAVALFSAVEADWLIPAAVDIANRAGAHLIGVHPVVSHAPFAAMEGGLISYAVPHVPDWQVEETKAVAAAFAKATRAENFVADFRQQLPSEESSESYLLDNVAAADLVLFGQCPKSGARLRYRNQQERMIRHCGRPALMIPRDWTPQPFGAHVLLGWSNTREAIRAAHDARLAAQPGAAVSILHVAGAGSQSHGLTRREDLAAAFDRHGLSVTLIDRERSTQDIGSMLLKVAVECGADMLAVGAFGHSRAYDFVIGAVTHELLENAALPVLFSK